MSDDRDTAFEEYARSLFARLDAPAGIDRWRDAPQTVRHEQGLRTRGRRLVVVLMAAVVVTMTISGIAIAQRLLGPPRPDLPLPNVSSTPVPSPRDSPRPSLTPSVRPSPKRTVTRTPTPSARPPAPGWPGAGTTGVPDGTSLRRHVGDLHIRTPGAIVDGLLVTGSVFVEAPDVTLRRTRISPGDGAIFGVRQQPGARGLVIEECEIDGSVEYGVRQEAPGLTVRRSRIFRSNVGLVVQANASVTDSYIGEVTSMGIYHAGHGPRLVIRHNTIVARATGNSAIALYTDAGPQTYVLVQDNLLGGGNYTLAGGAGDGSHHIRVIGNRFGRPANYGPVVAFDRSAPGNVWKDNEWLSTGRNVPPP